MQSVLHVDDKLPVPIAGELPFLGLVLVRSSLLLWQQRRQLLVTLPLDPPDIGGTVCEWFELSQDVFKLGVDVWL